MDPGSIEFQSTPGQCLLSIEMSKSSKKIVMTRESSSPRAKMTELVDYRAASQNKIKGLNTFVIIL